MSIIFTGEENPEDLYKEPELLKNQISRSKTMDLSKNFQSLKINTLSLKELNEETKEQNENKETTKFAETTPINYKLIKQVSNENINIKKNNYYANYNLDLNESNNPFLFTISSSDLSTPDSIKNNLTSPKNKFEKKKKSKKRTPCFSSKRLNFIKNENYKSDIKFPSENLLKLFERSCNKNNLNDNKNIFLELIEESSNELLCNVNDNENNIFNVIDSNYIISSLFNDNKENPEKKNLIGEKIEKEINFIIEKINQKNFNINEDFNIYIINKDCSVREMNKSDFLICLNKIVCFEKEGIIGDGKIYIPTKYYFYSYDKNKKIIIDNFEEREGRVIFKLIKENDLILEDSSNNNVNINLNLVKNIKLISIEIHSF